MCEEGPSYANGRSGGDAGHTESTQLVDRIRQHEAMEKLQGVKIVLRKGIPIPSAEDLQSIADHRERMLDLMRMKRQLQDVERRKGVWQDYVSYELENRAIDQVQKMYVEATSLDGRAAILSHLLAMFRMLICDNRAKKRLEKLRTRQSLLVPETITCNSEEQTVVEAVRLVEEHLTVSPAYVNRTACSPKLFLMSDAFDIKPLRSPFIFLSKQYKTERPPEFSIDLSQAASKEYAAYVKDSYNEHPTKTLSDFVQPLVTLETFDVHKRAYDVIHRRNLVLGYDAFSGDAQPSECVTHVEKCEEAHKTNNGTARSVGLFPELFHLGVPSKLSGPLPEDSLSESDNEDASPLFQPDISWLPSSPTLKNNVNEEVEEGEEEAAKP